MPVGEFHAVASDLAHCLKTDVDRINHSVEVLVGCAVHVGFLWLLWVLLAVLLRRDETADFTTTVIGLSMTIF